MPLIFRHYTPSSVVDLTCSVVPKLGISMRFCKCHAPAISFCALFSPSVTWNARSCTIRKHTLSKNSAFPTWAGHAVPGSSIYHRMTRASLRSWEVSVFWSLHCGVQISVLFRVISHYSKILWDSKVESRHTSHEMQLWGLWIRAWNGVSYCQ